MIMADCIFCKIADKEIPGKIIHEDDLCIAFLDLSQATVGHTLVIPKKHYDSMLTADPEIIAHVFKVAQVLANRIKERFNASGCNVLTNAGEAAGQTVHHFHVHVIPRYDENDGLKISFVDHRKDVDLDNIYQSLMK
jgi:histidine triad (HIT) family protein